MQPKTAFIHKKGSGIARGREEKKCFWIDKKAFLPQLVRAAEYDKMLLLAFFALFGNSKYFCHHKIFLMTAVNFFGKTFAKTEDVSF